MGFEEPIEKNVGQLKEVGAGNFENFHPGARAKGRVAQSGLSYR